MPYDECHRCGREYERIAQHWSMSNCEYPELGGKQMEIATGLLMGDGNIEDKSKHPYIRTHMITPDYLEYLDSKFGKLSRGVKKSKTADELAERDRQSGFNSKASAENYHDLYSWSSITHPELESLAEWYKSGKKIWPESLELTPIVLKHWYCCDGCYNTSDTNGHIKISMSNEINNRGKVDNIFRSAGLPEPSNYNITEREDGSERCDAEFTVSASEQLFEYMGKPLPGFNYKW